MLSSERIDVPEGIDISNKKKCIKRVRYLSLLLIKGFNHMYAMPVMMSMNLCDIAILNIGGFDYCCIYTRIS